MTDPSVNPLRAEILNRSQLGALPKPAPLIKGILNLNSTAWIAGPPGSYKTFLALDYGLHVATGRDYQGIPVAGGNVLYVAGEGTSGLDQRITAWEKARGLPVEYMYFLTRAVPVTHSDWYHLIDVAKTMEARMVILDTQARMAGGLDENSVPDMGRYISGVDAMREATGACVTSIHHSSKGGSALRGSSAVQGAADTIITVEAREGAVGIHNLKQKDMAQFTDHWMEPAEYGESCILVPCGQPANWEQPKKRTGYAAQHEN